MAHDTPCFTCAFSLWKSYASFPISTLGLYSDARFPGRSILKLTPHYEHLHQVPHEVLSTFMAELQTATRLLKEITAADRINVAILGNTVAHLHAHLIPRYGASEPLPEKSPWDDPRPRSPLSEEDERRLLEKLRQGFTSTR
jgi:diadenosine tetraphosphate (Ap4A) HIT family hydrolase